MINLDAKVAKNATTLTMWILGLWVVCAAMFLFNRAAERSSTLTDMAVLVLFVVPMICAGLSAWHLYGVIRNRHTISWFPKTIGSVISIVSLFGAIPLILFSLLIASL